MRRGLLADSPTVIPCGHFSVTVQNFLIFIAFRGRALFEPFQEILESYTGLVVSQQHIQQTHNVCLLLNLILQQCH